MEQEEEKSYGKLINGGKVPKQSKETDIQNVWTRRRLR